MYATHSQSCSGQITICPCRSAGLAWKIWQSLLGAGICGKSFGTAKIALSFWIMSFTSLKDIDASRSQSLETFGAMHGVRTDHSSAHNCAGAICKRTRWMRLALVAQLNTNWKCRLFAQQWDSYLPVSIDLHRWLHIPMYSNVNHVVGQ